MHETGRAGEEALPSHAIEAPRNLSERGLENGEGICKCDKCKCDKCKL